MQPRGKKGEGDGQVSEISELEGRITQALMRVRYGLGSLQKAVPGQSVEDFARLEVALDEEKAVNVQLQERIAVLKQAQDAVGAEFEARIVAQSEALAGLDREMQALRQTNAELREIAAQLRRALAEGASEPELINRAMQAELDALTAARESEIAEVDAIMAELRDVIGEAG